jgi:RimJ/RimL family protein N-acetyltransferase
MSPPRRADAAAAAADGDIASKVLVRAANLDDLPAFSEHILVHSAESGVGGSAHFAIARRLSYDDVLEAARARWQRRLTEPLWGRAWLLVDMESDAVPARGRRRGSAPPPGHVVGHVELRGGRLKAELHRAVLAMGLQRSFTAQGHGGRLIEAAIRWAREEAGLSWIDLGVFAHNERARRLYRRMGFVELGVHPDAFRIDAGISVDDVQMTLKL